MLSQVPLFFSFNLAHLINCLLLSLVTCIYLGLLALALELALACIHRKKPQHSGNQKQKFKTILTFTESYKELKKGPFHNTQQTLKTAFLIFVSLSLSLSIAIPL